MLEGLSNTQIDAALIGGYLLGSIPFGVIVMKAAGAGDPRAIGSGNIGATNVLRSGRRDLAALTLIGDGGKGAVAVLIAWMATRGSSDQAQAVLTCLAGGAAFFGHIFPIFLGFKGGKGVATFFGTLLAAAWPVGMISRGDLAADGGGVPDVFAGRADGGGGGAAFRPTSCSTGPTGRGAGGGDGRADLHPPPRQHPPPAEGRRAADRGFQTGGGRVTEALSEAERRDWLKLSRTENVGPVTFDQLVRRFGAAGEALAALPDLARRGGARQARRC